MARPLPRPVIAGRWPRGRPRVLVSDAWLANAGDAAVALATDRRVRELLPGAAVIHAAYQSHVLAERYPELALAPPLEALARTNVTAPEAAGWRAEDLEALLGGADMVLSQGGGFAFEHYEPRHRVAAWAAVTGRGIPFAICAQSIGHFTDPEMRGSVARALAGACAITVRDADSQHAVEAMAPGASPRTTADQAFLLTAGPPRRPREPAGVAVVLTDHVSHGPHPKARAPASPEVAASLLQGIARAAAPEPVHAFSTAQGLADLDPRADDDGAFAARAVALLDPGMRAAVHLHRGYHTPADAIARLREVRAVVTQRLHAAILALGSGTPAVLASDAFKATEMFAGLGLGRWLAPVGDDGGPVERLRWALADAPRDRVLWESLEPAREAARANDLVVEALAAAAAARSRPSGLARWYRRFPRPRRPDR